MSICSFRRLLKVKKENQVSMNPSQYLHFLIKSKFFHMGIGRADILNPWSFSMNSKQIETLLKLSISCPADCFTVELGINGF